MTDKSDSEQTEAAAETKDTEAPVVDGQDAQASAEQAAEPDGQPAEPDETSGTSRWRSRRTWLSVAAAVVLAVVIAGGVFGYLKYKGVSDELAALHQAEADRVAAVQLAKDYAMKSLTYSFKDPDAFFASVKEGVSPTLADKYTNASDLLKGIMLQAQVTSTGEVLATQAIPQPGDVYQVVVSASQTTRNLQNPEERVSLILLQITLNKVDGKWQVSDIGPKTGTQAPDAGQLPPAVEPGP